MATENLVIKTSNGPVKGFSDTHPVQQYSTQSSATRGHLAPVLKWLGIPYAKAERFHRPTNPDPWEQEKQCFEFGTMFPQPQGMTEQLLSKLPGFVLRSQIKQSEQSHFVNVFAPGDLKEGEKLPVMVFIYGGALNTGSSDRFFYDPTSLVRSQSPSQRCILVTGNYRINIFGFLSSPDLSASDPASLSGNYGLYDCIKLFEWVQENIGEFGGNPKEVTAFGQSAGAFLISYLLISGKHLFNRAILQSGAQKTMGIRPPSSAYPALPSILSSLRESSPSSSSATPLDLLHSASTSELLSLHTSHHSLESVSLTLEPSSSSHSIFTSSSISRLEQGSIDPWISSLILGTTQDEGTVFAYGAKLSIPSNFNKWINRFSSETQEKVRSKYLEPFGGVHPKEGECELKDLPGSRLLSDQIFVNPVWELAKAVRGEGREVWMYRLRTGVKNILDNSPFGIMHSMDLPLIFNCSSLWSEDVSSNDAKTSKALGSRWLNYGATGQPDQEWIPFEIEKEKASWLVFEEGGVTKNESLERFEEEMVRLVVEPEKKEEGQEEGDETLGTTTE